MAKNKPAVQETWIRAVGQEDLEKGILTSVFLPGESHGQWSLEGCSLWGHKESDITEQLSQAFIRRGVLVPKHSPVPTWSGDSGSFIEGQEVDSFRKPGFTQVPHLVCCMLISGVAANNRSKPSSKPGGSSRCPCVSLPCLSVPAPDSAGWRGTLRAGQGCENESQVTAPVSCSPGIVPFRISLLLYSHFY